MMSMLYVSAVIGLMSSVLEIKIVTRFKFLMKIYKDGFLGIPGSFFDLVGSFLLSGLIGAGAGGTIIGMMSGVIGVFSSMLFWSIKRQLNENGFTWAKFKTDVAEFTSTLQEHKENLLSLLRGVKALFILIAKIIWAPFAAIIWAMNAWNNFKQKATSISSSVKQAA